MSDSERTFLLDANVFIGAHRAYYAFDLCPGFWQSIFDGYKAGRIFSTERVRKELLKGNDELTNWAELFMPDDFFLDDSSATVIGEYGPMMTWVLGRDFLPAAKAKFATDADGWLVAMAKNQSFCVVTHERRDPAAKARVTMPILCEEFAVDYCNTFEMLRELGCKFQ